MIEMTTAGARVGKYPRQLGLAQEEIVGPLERRAVPAAAFGSPGCRDRDLLGEDVRAVERTSEEQRDQEVHACRRFP